MLIPSLLFILGLILLIRGGDWFVRGAVGIAQFFHVPEFIIGATVVSIGTTLPEVMVSSSAALAGHGEIAYGNALGSIICNTALIAAVTIAIRPSRVDTKTLRAPIIFFLIASCFYTVTAILKGSFSRLSGAILLLLFVFYMIFTVISGKKHGNVDLEEIEETSDKISTCIFFLVLGAVLIAFGADLLVDNGTLIASALGVPESVIALTFVALGTSLPELVTAISSLVKGHSSLSLGNIVGANIFNLVLVSGTAALLSPFSVPTGKEIMGIPASYVLDIPVMLLVSLILIVPALWKGKLSRVQGISLLLIYAAFCAVQFIG